MNNIERRLFQTFMESGGNARDEGAVAGLIDCVENTLLVMPTRVRTAVEFFWRGSDGISYEEVAARLRRRERTAVTVAAAQQRVSRGVRRLEEVIRRQKWKRPATANTPPPTRGER